MESIVIDVLGWAGSILLIVAYWLVSRKSVKPESYGYHFLNIFASLLLIINTYYYGAFPSAAVNITWIFIGLFYLIKKRKNEP